MTKKTKDELVFCAPGVIHHVGGKAYKFGDAVPAKGFATPATKRTKAETHADAIERLKDNGEVCSRSVLEARLKRERGEAEPQEAEADVPDSAQE